MLRPRPEIYLFGEEDGVAGPSYGSVIYMISRLNDFGRRCTQGSPFPQIMVIFTCTMQRT